MLRPMEMLASGGQAIRTVDDWERLAGPTSKKHWRDGYSAKELANAWAPENGTGAAETVTAHLREALGDSTLELTTGWPEHRTRFDANPRGPRVHDLLVHATSAAGPVVIGVEGKGFEGFGLPLGEHLASAAANPASGTPARVEALVSGFFGEEVPEELDTVGYQLLSALAGTLVEATKAGAVSAVVLVHEFRFDHSDKKAQAANSVQLEAFVGALGARPANGPSGGSWWITQPVDVPGANDLMARARRCDSRSSRRTSRPRPPHRPELSAVRFVVWIGTWLAPLDPWIRRHPWLTSLLAALTVAAVFALIEGAEKAAVAFVGILPACRFVLYMVATGAFGPDDDYPFG